MRIVILRAAIILLLLLSFSASQIIAAQQDPFTSDGEIMRSTLILIHYAKASDVAALLKEKGSGLLSVNGHVSVDERTNALWVYDTKASLSRIHDFLYRLDVPAKQVFISAKIVSVDDSFAKELGSKFGTMMPDLTSIKDKQGFNIDMPMAKRNGHFDFSIAKLGKDRILDLELSALETEGHAKIISSPKLLTLNRKPAYIESGEEIPYKEHTASGATSVAFKKAVLSLKVTPEVTVYNKVALELTINQDKISPIAVNGVPAIQTREMKTDALVDNGQTVVLGGIYEQYRHEQIERLPILGSLPLIGILFRYKTNRTDRRELLVFVTPEIVSGNSS